MITMTFRRKMGSASILAKADKVHSGLQRAVDISAEQVSNTAKHLIESPPKSGRVYRRKGRPDHQASAPGEAPATDTALLVNSIGNDPDGDLARVVTARTKYAMALEFGSVNMEPRPFMTPAAEKVKPAFVERCEKAFSDGLK